MVTKLEPYFEDEFNQRFEELKAIYRKIIDQRFYIALLKQRQNFSSPERKAFVLESANDMLKIRLKELDDFRDKYRNYFQQFGIQL